MILDLVSTCGDPALVEIFMIIQNVIKIIHIAAPIIAIVSLSIHFFKCVSNPDDKKNLPFVKNWAIALLVIYLVPVFVNVTMNLLGTNYTVSSCWNYAEEARDKR